MDFSDLKNIAVYLKEIFDGTPEISRYYCSDESRYVDIISVTHESGLSDVGTIGGCLRKNHTKPEIPVEIVGVVEHKYLELFSETISFIVLCMDTDKCCYLPGTVIFNAIPDNNYQMKHIYLCYPFCWNNGIETLNIKEQNVAFLQALPISETERIFLFKHGIDAFENLLEETNAQYFDLNRKSII